MSTTENRLAGSVKRFLDIIWYVLIFTAVVWPIAVIIIGLSMPSDDHGNRPYNCSDHHWPQHAF